MASWYTGLLGGDPIRGVARPDFRDYLDPALGVAGLLSSAYTDKGILPLGQFNFDWSRTNPGKGVVPYVDDTPSQRFLNRNDYYDPGSGPEPGDISGDEPFFDPLGVEGYLIKESPGFKFATNIGRFLGPPFSDFSTFLAITGADAERRAIELNRAQYESAEPLGLAEGCSRDYQLDIDDMGLPEGERPGGDPMTAEEHAATQYGYFPSEDEGRYAIDDEDYEVPSWLEAVERSEAEGGPYTQVPKSSMYNEEDLARFYGHYEPPGGYPSEYGRLVGGDPSGIGNLGLQTDIRDDPNYYTGEWEVGKSIPKALDMLFNTPWTGYDPARRTYDIYTHNLARDARDVYAVGGRDPLDAPAEWTDPVTGLTRSNYTQADRDAYREMEDARRWAEAASDDRVTGDWNPLTEPEMIDQYDQWGNPTGQISSAELTWNENINDPHKNEPGYHINLDWTDPDFDRKSAENDAAIAAMQARADARGVTVQELANLEEKEQEAADRQAAQKEAAAHAVQDYQVSYESEGADPGGTEGFGSMDSEASDDGPGGYGLGY